MGSQRLQFRKGLNVWCDGCGNIYVYVQVRFPAVSSGFCCHLYIAPSIAHLIGQFRCYAKTEEIISVMKSLGGPFLVISSRLATIANIVISARTETVRPYIRPKRALDLQTPSATFRLQDASASI